jgi:hypothetical protein
MAAEGSATRRAAAALAGQRRRGGAGSGLSVARFFGPRPSRRPSFSYRPSRSRPDADAAEDAQQPKHDQDDQQEAEDAAEAERLTRRRAPLPPSRPSAWHRERLELLQAALSYPEMHGRLTETTRLPLSALERVATGRSTMGATAWRRLLVELDR